MTVKVKVKVKVGGHVVGEVTDFKPSEASFKKLKVIGGQRSGKTLAHHGSCSKFPGNAAAKESDDAS